MSGRVSGLAKYGVVYRQLLMLDLPSKQERIRLKANALFKADAYTKPGASLCFPGHRLQNIPGTFLNLAAGRHRRNSQRLPMLSSPTQPADSGKNSVAKSMQWASILSRTNS